LTGINVPGTKGRCNLPAHNPWSRLQILAHDSESSQWLDFTTLSSSAEPHWNARTGMLRWADGQGVFGPELTVLGASGELTFTIAVNKG
jgi:hypothetical protein